MSNPLQKQAILSLSYSGLRVTELSLLLVEDVLTKKGKLKSEIYLRAEITKGCRPRSVWVSCRTTEILSNYLEHRIEKRLGTVTNLEQYKRAEPQK